jgi:hypothetical protein
VLLLVELQLLVVAAAAAAAAAEVSVVALYVPSARLLGPCRGPRGPTQRRGRVKRKDRHPLRDTLARHAPTKELDTCRTPPVKGFSNLLCRQVQDSGPARGPFGVDGAESRLGAMPVAGHVESESVDDKICLLWVRAKVRLENVPRAWQALTNVGSRRSGEGNGRTSRAPDRSRPAGRRHIDEQPRRPFHRPVRPAKTVVVGAVNSKAGAALMTAASLWKAETKGGKAGGGVALLLLA